MSINLALHDAATNCARDNAICTLTLKSGVQMVGHLKKAPDTGFAYQDTLHIETDSGGWTTVVKDEVAAVGVEKRRPF